MNILKPNLVIVDGRCYRQLHLSDQNYEPNRENEPRKVNLPSQFDTEDLYSDEPVCGAPTLGSDGAEQSSDSPPQLDVKFNGKDYSLELNISQAYYGVIIGRGGEALRRVESETEARIKIPQAGATGPVVLTARTVRAIHACNSRIEVLIESAKKRFKATHFLSIPVNFEKIQKSFKVFCEGVEKECGLKGPIFQRPERLHLTIGLLLLNDAVEVKAAVDELKKCKEELARPILDGHTLNVHLCGLEYMNDDPSCVNVLYAKLKPSDQSNSLQQIADGLVQRFKARGLLHAGQGPSSISENVKLHVTLMNSTFCQQPDDVSVASQQKRPADRRTAFDANKILKVFGNFDFGAIDLSEIHISKRGEYNYTNGYYRSEATVPLSD